MSTSEDYYALLGVSRSAPEREIVRAYRKRVFECHPDHHPGDAQAIARFKRLTQAFEVLSNSQQRQLYDLQLMQQSALMHRRHSTHRPHGYSTERARKRS